MITSDLKNEDFIDSIGVLCENRYFGTVMLRPFADINAISVAFTQSLAFNVINMSQCENDQLKNH